MQARHQTFRLQTGHAKIKINSDFDSGNLEKAIFKDQKLILTPALDPMHPQFSIKPSSKTFFHFSISSDTNISLSIIIQRMNILSYFSNEDNFSEIYRICVGRKHKKSWESLITYEKVRPEQMKRIEREGSFELHFQFELKQQEEVYFSYHFPYPFEKIQTYLRQYKERVNNLNTRHNSNIYFTNQVLIQSLEGRPINLLTITDGDYGKKEESQARISRSLFPFFQLEGRPKKFNKPYVFLTCRVHSGQTSSSYALEGILNFLLSQDKQSTLLLKSFVFLIVPVLNPDGVYHGTYRMDTLGHNLNRFYNTAQSHKQPSIFAVQTLVTHYSERVVFFVDFHSHPHPNKGSFIYGNSLPSIEEQTQSQLFAKLLSFQSQCFGYQISSFSSQQMNSRDMNELLTKDGSARVQLYKILNIPFAFTMEMGYHGTAVKKNDSSIFTGDYKRQEKVFSIVDYQQHGKSVVVTLLQMYLLNCSKGQNSQKVRVFQGLRQQICKQLLQKEERFRQMDALVFKKVKNINEIVYEQYYHDFFKKFPLVDNILKESVMSETKDSSIRQTADIDIEEIKKKTIFSPRKQFSVRLSNISKTICVPQKHFAIRSFKSTIQTRRNSPRTDTFQSNRDDSFKFAKKLTLNFNPFPEPQKKKIYNMIGNRRSLKKSMLMNQIEFNDHNLFDIDTIDINSQLEKAEVDFKIEQDKDLLRRNKVCFFAPKATETQEDPQVYNDMKLDQSDENKSFILPRIPQKQERQLKQFQTELLLSRQNEKKYRLQEMKHLSPSHIKTTLRANSLRIKNLAKYNK